MKPRNIFQKQIVDASRKLPKITDAQIQWAYRNCIEHIGCRTSKGIITCTHCGHAWKGDGELVDILSDCNCPECQTKLKVENTRQRKFYDYEYLCIVTACKGYQVLRFLYVECTAKVGEKARYSHIEAVQRWIAPNGRYATMARLRPMGYFVHGWSWSSTLEIRPEKPMYNITPTLIYPRQKLIPEVERTGYKQPYGKLTPFDLIHTLLSQDKAETLLKTGQTDLLHHFAYNEREIEKYWPSIRIAIRNGYKITNASDWLDHIDLLRHFGKDLHNAKYVCPADLKAEHNKYIAQRQAQLERRRIEEKKQRAIQHEEEFKIAKGKFFGVEFTDGTINVRVLESVTEIMIEGEKLHHCVYTNNYFKREDSLILSATIDGEKVETVEFSLSRLAIQQCRGLQNKTTEHHQRIIDLVNKNIPLIKKRLTA